MSAFQFSNSEQNSEVEFGRASCFREKEAEGEFLIEAGGAPGHPRVSRIAFELQDEKIASVCKATIPPSDQSLSRSGNGTLFFYGIRDGLFLLSNIAKTGRRMGNYYVFVKNGKHVASIDAAASNEDIVCFAKEAGYDFAQEISERKNHRMKVAEVAARISESVKNERKALSSVVLMNSDALNCVFEVYPVFDELPDGQTLFDATQSENFNECEYVVQLAAPSYYKIKDIFIKDEFGGEYKVRGESAYTAEDAVSKTEAQAIAGLERTKAARAKQAQADAEEDERIEIAEKEKCWPRLAGSEKMIAWARKIRYRASQSNPSDAALKRAKTAAYWIDRRPR